MANTTLYENFERVKQYIGQEVGLATNDLVSYSYLEDKHYLSESDLSAYATKAYVVDYVNTYAPEPDLSAYVTKVELNEAGYISSIPSEYITDSELSACGYATQTYVTNAIAEIPAVDLSAYVTKVELNEAGYISSIPSEYITDSELSACGYATQTYVTNAIAEIPAVDLSAYATKAYVSSSVASLIDDAPEGLNTLDKLAYAINDDPDFAYNISVLIDEKADTAYVYTKSEINELNTYTQGRINNLSATVGIIEVNFVSKLSLDQAGYATKTYVVDYVATYGMPDLSSYATKSYVADYVNTYAAQPDLSAYVTKVELSNAGYISSIPSEYVTDSELSSCGYATQSYVVDYVAEHGGSTVIDENIIPKANNTYTLGNHDYYYAATYTNVIGGYTGLFIKVNNNNRVYYGNSQLRPDVNNYINFGTSNYKWKAAYSYNYYVGDEGEIRELFPSYAYVVDYVASYAGGSEVTYSYLSDNYLALAGGAMAGQLQLNNNIKLRIGSERPWNLYESGTGGATYVCLQNEVDGKHFYIRDMNNHDIVDVHNSIPGNGYIRFNYNANTYVNNIVPNANNTYNLGNADYIYGSTYTNILQLNPNIKFVPESDGSSNLNLRCGADFKYFFSPTSFNPHGVGNAGKINLGRSDRPWGSTYTNNLYLTYNAYATNIIPTADNTYTLGSSSEGWAATYTENLYSPSLVLSYSYNSIDNASNTQINFKVNQWNRMKLTNTALMPSTNNGIKLGDSGAQWSTTYVRDLFLDGTDIKTLINNMFSYDSATGTLTITTLS